MSGSSVSHNCSFMNFIGLLIDHKTVVWIDASNLIFLLFASNNKNLVLSLNTSKVCRKLICISELNTLCSLWSKFVNIKMSAIFIKVMKSGFRTCKNIIWIKANNIVKKTSKFVNFTFNLNIWSRIFIEKI